MFKNIPRLTLVIGSQLVLLTPMLIVALMMPDKMCELTFGKKVNGLSREEHRFFILSAGLHTLNAAFLLYSLIKKRHHLQVLRISFGFHVIDLLPFLYLRTLFLPYALVATLIVKIICLAATSYYGYCPLPARKINGKKRKAHHN